MSVVRTMTNPARGVYQATWAALANGESGDAADLPVEASTRSAHVSGTFGAGGSVTLDGSNDGISWAPLSNSFVGTAFAITAAAIHDILQNTRFVRPRVTAGDGATALKVVITAV